MRDEGGCYCACRLVDSIHSLESAIEGYTLVHGSCFFPSIEARNSRYEKLSQELREREDHYQNIEAPKLLKQATELLESKYTHSGDF